MLILEDIMRIFQHNLTQTTVLLAAVTRMMELLGKHTLIQFYIQMQEQFAPPQPLDFTGTS